ncbi:MAG: recombinase family protein [Proteobacteria bacterium]|nr:recombinase family protein [Pseudomonadota bacterium]
MGVLADAISALKDVLQMRGDMDRLARNVDTLTQLMTDLDRRLIRIETMVEIAGKRSAAAPRLPKK